MPQSHRLSRLASITALCTLAIATTAPAQTPAGPPPPDAQHHGHRGPRPKPTNLQVLSKDLTGDQVIDIMHKFEGELGVECDYCHAKNPNPTPTTGHLDFASDANPVKDRARVMLRMNMEINQHFLAQLKDPAPAHEVSCGTCHRGNAKPIVFVPPPDEHHHGGPPPSGPPPATAPPQ